MTAYIEEMQRKIELLLNEVTADQTVERVVIQALLLALFSQRADALQGLRNGVVAGLSQMPPNPDDIQGSERKKQLTIIRAEMFFQDIDRGIAAGGSTPPKDAH